MIHPLKIWKSEKVKILLSDFYELNFIKANIEKNLGKKIVDQSWNLKVSVDEKDMKDLNIELFNIAKKQANSGIEEVDLWSLINLEEVGTFVDIGANKLRRINELTGIYRDIGMFIGVDVVPQSSKFNFPERSRYIEIKKKVEWKGEIEGKKSKVKNQNLNETRLDIESGSVDLVNIQFVLHHFESDAEIEDTLREAYRILKPGGRLLLWEESWSERLSDLEIRDLVIKNNALGIETDFELTRRFYELSDEEKFEFIIVNDWIINVNNDHMQWTGLYKTWEGWVEMLEGLNVESSKDTKVKNQKSKGGFKLINHYNLGLRKNAMVKQGVHVVGEFLKQ